MKYPFVVIQGHQVASGRANDARFPNGTIAAQKPYFKDLGLDLSRYFSATINAEFNCHKVNLINADYTFENVKWHKWLPAENFKFYPCQLYANHKRYSGFIYQPQLDTKIEHFQPENTIELIMPFIENIHYGDTLHIECHHLSLK